MTGRSLRLGHVDCRGTVASSAASKQASPDDRMLIDVIEMYDKPVLVLIKVCAVTR